MKRLFALLLLGTLALAPLAAADELTVAAASDLSFAFKELSAEFQKRTGHTVKLSLGSSGNFYSQIQNGAPFDLFFSADIGYPQKLVEQKLAEPDSLYKYATGRIVIWTRKDVALDLQRLGMNALLEGAVRKIAIANPRHAPYGRAAVAAMQKLGVYDKVTSKLVFGENISQTAQFVESGNADAGILALSLAVAPAMQGKGKYWEIPADAYPPIDQGVAIVKASPHKQAAAAFLDYLKSAEGTALMKRYGFVLPATPAVAAPARDAAKDRKKGKKG
jgi:molybdate transport system substrate-binding protein